MAEITVGTSDVQLVIPAEMYGELQAHLFPGDEDEHGAVILAGISRAKNRVRLLVKELHLAMDGIDYVPSTRGYRKLKAEFIQSRILKARDERLVYLAIHNHQGADNVWFSMHDMASHERGYPALIDIARGMPVGALVFANNAVAGDIWLSQIERRPLSSAVVLGKSIRRIYPAVPKSGTHFDPRYHRQSLIFGKEGQLLLGSAKVAIIGLGGAGSQLADFLSALGVGNFVLIDPDRLELSNIPRVVRATGYHVRSWLLKKYVPAWLKEYICRTSTKKVKLSKKVIKSNNPNANVVDIFGDFTSPDYTCEIIDCDYIFLAADTHRARLLFNAIVHQYFIPGVQVGAKVHVDSETGRLLDIFSVCRPVRPGHGCLWCNGLINSSRLQMESLTTEQLKAQRYGVDENIEAPSVNTLNALSTSQAANDFLFYYAGMTMPGSNYDYVRFSPLLRGYSRDEPRKDPNCPECSNTKKGRYGRGESIKLPMQM